MRDHDRQKSYLPFKYLVAVIVTAAVMHAAGAVATDEASPFPDLVFFEAVYGNDPIFFSEDRILEGPNGEVTLVGASDATQSSVEGYFRQATSSDSGCPSLRTHLDRTKPPESHERLDDVIAETQIVVHARVSRSKGGFLFQEAGTLLELEDIKVRNGELAPREAVYVFVPAGRIKMRSRSLCVVDEHWQAPPKKGDQMLLFLEDTWVNQNSPVLYLESSRLVGAGPSGRARFAPKLERNQGEERQFADVLREVEIHRGRRPGRGGRARPWDLCAGGDASNNPLVRVAVIDNGIDLEHPDLQALAGKNFAGEGGTATGTGHHRHDADKWLPDPDDDPVNCEWHGTHVAGMVGMMNNTDSGAQIGGIGVVPEGSVVAARAHWIDWLEDPGPGTTVSCGWQANQDADEVASAITWSGGMGGAQVTVHSWQLFTGNAIELAYNQIRDAGVIAFASAGNNNFPEPTFPANLESVNAVGAIDITGAR